MQVMVRMAAERLRLCRRGAASTLAAALVVVAGASSVGGAGKGESALFSPQMLWTYVTGGPALSGYSRAMTQYRLLLERSLGSIGVAGLINPADYGDERWTWRAPNGSLIRRLDDGRFSVTEGNCVSSLCRELFCYDAGWPMFMCDDGSTRKMSAPDFSTVVFDGVTFTRTAPASVAVPQDGADPEAPPAEPGTPKPEPAETEPPPAAAAD